MADLLSQKAEKVFVSFFHITIIVICLGLLASCSGNNKVKKISTPTGISADELRLTDTGGIDSSPLQQGLRGISSEKISTGDVTGTEHITSEIIVILKSKDDWLTFSKYLASKEWTVTTYIEGIDSYTIQTNTTQESILKGFMKELKGLPYVDGVSLNMVVQGAKSLSKNTIKNGNIESTGINMSGNIPFDIKKLDAKSLAQIANGKTIDEISGYIINQYWITSGLSPDELESLIQSKYQKLAIIAKSTNIGILVEINDNDAVLQLDSLRRDVDIVSVYNQTYVGKNFKRTF